MGKFRYRIEDGGHWGFYVHRDCKNREHRGYVHHDGTVHGDTQARFGSGGGWFKGRQRAESAVEIAKSLLSNKAKFGWMTQHAETREQFNQKMDRAASAIF